MKAGARPAPVHHQYCRAGVFERLARKEDGLPLVRVVRCIYNHTFDFSKLSRVLVTV